MPRLQVLNGKRQGAIYEVKPGTKHVIGHRQTASITIDDPWVSWDHAQLFFNPDDGACWIEDLGSTNGTYVNCVRVKRECLRHEDIVFLGKTHVIYLCPAEEHSGGGFDDLAPSSADALSDLPVAAAAAPPPPPPAAKGPGLAVSSASGPFLDESGLTPLHALTDPSAPPPPSASHGAGKKRDPFQDSGVDPFSSGPDYAALPQQPPGGSQRATTAASSAASRRMPVTPGYTIPLEASSERPPPIPVARGPFAETNADEANPYAKGSQRALNLSELQQEDRLPRGPSHQELSRLLDGYDDLDAILGEGRALTPGPQPIPPELRGDPLPRAGPGKGTMRLDPQVPRPSGRVKALGPGSDAPSEMRTRLVDTGEMARMLAEDEAGRAPPPPPPPPPPPAGGLADAPTDRTEDAPGLPQDLGQLAFERARLEDEVRRVRAALSAATARDPQAVRAAAQALREQELGRLDHHRAKLEQEVVQLRQTLQTRDRELNAVTEEMIEKEDQIEALQRQVEAQRRQPGSDPRAARAGRDQDLRGIGL